MLISAGVAAAQAQIVRPSAPPGRATAVGDGVRRCGTPDPRAGVELEKRRVEGGDCTFFMTHIDPQYDPGPVFEVPVVVHVITADDGVTGDVPDERITSQIDVLNEDLLAYPGSPGGNGPPAAVRFVLAEVDPEGRPTAGVTRTANSAWFADPVSEVFKMALVWDPDRYLNFYTNDTEFLGYAYLPQDSAGEWWDGIVVYHGAFGRDAPDVPFDQGRTATHEVGHYLGLFHPFDREPGDPVCPDPDPPACYANGDLICDTPPDAAAHAGCARGAESCGFLAPITNYMEYSEDRCLEEFTAEQINRMRCSTVTYRDSLYSLAHIFGDGFEYGLERWGDVVGAE